MNSASAKVLPCGQNACTARPRRPICDGAPKERKQNAAHSGGILGSLANKSALAELRRTTSSLEAVLRSFLSRFSLVFRAFPDFSLFSYPMW